MTYQWIKAFHIIAMVAWFAGLFYIFRLYVYHVKHRERPGMAEAYAEMERKLLRIIMDPAMTVTLVLGIALIVMNPVVMKQGWMHVKLTAVVLLMGYHIFAGITRRRFARGDYFLSERACRMINEVPTLLLIVAVLMVVLKPF
jgi:putative membrane protein